MQANSCTFLLLYFIYKAFGGFVTVGSIFMVFPRFHAGNIAKKGVIDVITQERMLLFSFSVC